MSGIKFFTKQRMLVLLAGAFLSLAFAPVYFFVAAIISLSFFYLALEQENRPKEIFWLGFFFGFGHFLSGIYWIAISLTVDARQFGWLIPFALVIIPSILAVYLGLFALTYKKLLFTETYQKILSFALCWLLFEVLRANLLSGFPWNLLGYAWMFDLHFTQLASVFGIYGLSFFAVLVALFPVLFWKRKSSFGNKIFAAFLSIFLIGNLTFGYFAIDDKKLLRDEKTKLRLVQANVKQEIKWEENQKYQNFLKTILLTNSKNLDDIKAVIWAETSTPYVIDDNPGLLDHLKSAVPKNGVLITGALRVAYDERKKVSDVWNSIFVINEKGVSQHYDKNHLVPFGEYVPFHRFLSFLFLDTFIDKITGGGKGFSEGEGAQTLMTENFSFSPLICYEVIFSSEIVNKNHRPDLLVNLTNDAWFGRSSGPYQHFDMARMRAIEYGIPLVRVAGTGISAFVDPFGRIIAKIDLNHEGIVDVVLIKNSEPTIYATYGLLPLMALIALAMIPLIPRKKQKNDMR
ncbi:MAG: apolipoprotein N-acyltransferase [Alphaproteobacteria bacterium RIFCSPLOWO2_01_FULL_40_26]|nr:MAG: apolipoprotein N-acyltransferase [Alphaproteobacteria bacterium RIFCSPHIGHO2_02_FULL_40_34]OFW86045.1 MAG: apolipoprotein N-acyltransferase [Alphaproteobacteria bacterium RIFCSPHIGHO2_01_FULL_40_8]OFW95189.1 MAG: apolipoprotein N-acyltransferase [Alphaproteobacteria bacterium RIFCSPLOWO2_01_FULL_40_26]OFX09976.1 MAG: apolipoprotein N-acyltransferase [Alphaproteobacteria bacterium RIFCSPLOWO2_02_FULL_40_19]OFX12330.1 MAG: apolipoprotein N-acyltransferase [Alphaproteobacteria bacterium RI